MTDTQITPEEKAFLFSLDILKEELHEIDAAIARTDDMAVSTKKWAVTLWGGSIALAIDKIHTNQWKFVFLSALIPILMWLVDAHIRKIQRRFIFRSKMISNFINSSDLVESYRHNKIINFHVLDPKGKKYKEKECHNKIEMENFTSLSKTLLFRDVAFFYSSLLLMSGVVSLALYAFMP